MAKRLKKMLAMLLTLAMVLSMMSIPAFATEEDAGSEETIISEETAGSEEATDSEVFFFTSEQPLMYEGSANEDVAELQEEESDTTAVWNEEERTLTLDGAELTEPVELKDGYTIIVRSDSSIIVEGADAITCEGALTIKGEAGAELILSGSNGIYAASVSIEDVDVDIEAASCGIQVYNDAGDATVTLDNVDGSISGGYAGIYVNGECADSDASVTIDDCDLEVTSTATSYNNRARKSGITVYVSKAEKVESSITITDSDVKAVGSDAGLSINNYLGDADATNSASSKIYIKKSTVYAEGTNGTWSAIFASVLGQHPDADSIITITDSSVYAVSPNTGILTSSQAGESKILLDNSILGASGKTALSMIEPASQAQVAELKNGSTYVQMTPDAVMKGEISIFEGKTIIATAGDGITYNAAKNYFVIPQGSAVTETYTDGSANDYTFNGQAGGVGGFDYDKEEIWGYDVAAAKEIIIYTPEELVEFAKRTQPGGDLGDCEGWTVKLGADIDMSDYYWYHRNAAGEIVTDHRIPAFSGIFDGQDYTISGMKYLDEYKEATDAVPLAFIIECYNAPAVLKNLEIDGITVDTVAPARFAGLVDHFTAWQYSGDKGSISDITVSNITVNSEAALVFGGMMHKTFGLATEIEDCHVKNFTVNAKGALSGDNSGRCGGFIATGGETTDFVDCSVKNFVVNAESTGGYLGGFVGGASVSGDYFDCDVKGFELNAEAKISAVGGFAGYTAGSAWGSNSTYEDCDVSGLDIVTSDKFNVGAGGFIGNIYGQDNHRFLNCTTEGTISGDAYAGGFAGWLYGRTNCAAEFTDCSAAVNILDNDYYGAGFVGNFVPSGSNKITTTYTNCTASGDVFAKEPIGSFIDADTTNVDGIIGGTYNYDPENVDAETGETNNVAPGYRALDNGDGTWTVFPDLGLEVVKIAFHRWNDQNDAYENFRTVEVFKGVNFLNAAHDNELNYSHPIYRFKDGDQDGVADGLAELNKDAGSVERPFTYWTEAADGNGPEDLTNDTTIVGDMNVYVAYIPSFTVAYDYNGGVADEVSRSSVIVKTDSYTPVAKDMPGLPAPAKEGYTLTGWKYAVDSNPASEDLEDNGKWYMGETLYDNTRMIAQWEKTPVVETEKEDPIPVELGTKWDELLDRKTNRYTVNIDVPGANGIAGHDEVILMVDGSYSLDDEWPAMKEAINAIGRTVLNGSGTTQLTLMAFGMGDNIVLQHVKDADELAASLGELPGTLLYGRSSTNCEAGFDGVANYIKNHDNTLNDAHVIFISDGNINTDETPRAFAQNWKTWATKFGALTVAQAALELSLRYEVTDEDGNVIDIVYPAISDAFYTVFGNRFDGAASREEMLNRIFSEVTDEEFIAFADQIWMDVYAYSGLNIGVEYPVSVAERAFAKYDKEHGTYIQDAFYYTTYKSSYVGYGDRWTRTPAAANELAAMKEVEAMYVVDYDGYTSWMDTGITSTKSTFVQSNGVAGLVKALEGALGELAKAPINDPVITDYMSKWVNLDATTLKIIDNNTGAVLWTVADGWAEGVTPLTTKNPPVVVELVDPADYEAGGENVIGNTSGDIYKLTWYLKDGAMLRSDDFRLSYEVTVDTKEEGFVYETDYPANGNTYIEYTDEEGNEEGNEIDVPDVNAEPPAIVPEIVINKVDNKGNALTGAKFALYADDKLVGEYEVDQAGQISIQNLPVGTYKLVEIAAPDGYIGADYPMYFELVEAGESFEVKFGEFEVEFPATAYEISNHITSVAIPQTFVLLDAEDAGKWSYSDEYVFGESDYRVVYCGDSDVGVEDGTRYVQTPLEDCFDSATANQLRAIIANSYPYVSVEEMIAAAKDAGVADAENLTRGDIIAAVQLAIWHFTNGIEDYSYTATYSVEGYPRWGKVFNDYSDELPAGLPVGTSTKRIVDEASDARIRALYDYLLDLDPLTAEKSDVYTFFYTAVGGKNVSQSLIGGDRTDFYADGLNIYVKNTAEYQPAQLQVQKVDENGNPMTGAEFEVFAVNADGSKTSLGKFDVDAKGWLTLSLNAGDHLLVETKAPSGYLTAADPIKITVDDDMNIAVTETKAASYDGETLTVVNRPPHAAVVLTIDMSGTMYRYKMDGKRYVEVAKAKALEFVDQYAASTEHGGKRMLAVTGFDTDAKVVQNWIDVSTASGLAAAKQAITNMKVVDNGKTSSNYVCTNFDGGVILTRNLLKQNAVKDIDRCFAIILSDGAPTVTVNADTEDVGTIKSSFWGKQYDMNGKFYQNARCGGGWTHPAEVDRTWTYLKGLEDLTYDYTVKGQTEKTEGIFIIGVGGDMSVKLFNDAVYGTSNGTRTTDVKKKPAAFNYVDALQGYTSSQILKLTTGDWMNILATKVGGTYVSATNTSGLKTQFDNIMAAIKDTTTPES